MPKQELKKRLFKQILGAMIDVEFCPLSEEEVLATANGAIEKFKEIYLIKQK